MRNRAILFTLAGLAVISWLGLTLFMNRTPPSSLNQALLLIIWGMAVSLTLVPLAYLVNARLARPLGERASLRRATRQGILGGVLAAVLLALRFVRALNLLVGAVLLLVVVMVELLFQLRRR